MNYSQMLYSNRMRDIEKEITTIKEKIIEYNRYIEELETKKKHITKEFLSTNNNLIASVDVSHLLDDVNN